MTGPERAPTEREWRARQAELAARRTMREWSAALAEHGSAYALAYAEHVLTSPRLLEDDGPRGPYSLPRPLARMIREEVLAELERQAESEG